MPNHCAAGFCNSTPKDGVSVHYFPKNKRFQRLWIKFVQVKRADFIAPLRNNVLCSKHFKPEDFESSMMQALGFKGKSGTRLNKDAVPTIQAVPPRTGPAKPDASSDDRPAKKPRASTVVRKREVLRILAESREASVTPKEEVEAIKEDVPLPPPLPQMVSVAVQVRYRPPYRSKATQTTTVTRNKAVQCDFLPATFTPAQSEDEDEQLSKHLYLPSQDSIQQYCKEVKKEDEEADPLRFFS